MEPLLKDEQKLFDSLRGYLFTHRYSPSVRELVELFGRKSSDGVQRLLDQLREKGYVDWEKGKSRSYQLIAGNMPLRGVIQAGYVEDQPSDSYTYIDVPGARYSPSDYALKVQGDSMVDANICDGDCVIIRPVQEIQSLSPGTITAVWVEGVGTTLKYLYQEDGLVKLKPANRDFEIQIFDPNKVHPQGVLIGLHRSYEHSK